MGFLDPSIRKKSVQKRCVLGRFGGRYIWGLLTYFKGKSRFVTLNLYIKVHSSLTLVPCGHLKIIKAQAQSVFGSPSQSAGKVVELQPYTRLKRLCLTVSPKKTKASYNKVKHVQGFLLLPNFEPFPSWIG